MSEQPDAACLHPTSLLNSLSSKEKVLLRGLSIVCVEELLSLISTQEGKDGICRLLAWDDPLKLEGLLSEAKSIMGEDSYAFYMTPKAGGRFGCIIEEEEKDDSAQIDGGSQL